MVNNRGSGLGKLANPDGPPPGSRGTGVNSRARPLLTAPAARIGARRRPATATSARGLDGATAVLTMVVNSALAKVILIMVLMMPMLMVAL